LSSPGLARSVRRSGRRHARFQEAPAALPPAALALPAIRRESPLSVLDPGSRPFHELFNDEQHKRKLSPPAAGSASAASDVVGHLYVNSIAVHGTLVYVANAGDGGSNYTGFTLNPGGHLRPFAGSTVSLPDGSSPGDVKTRIRS
jgi:hypothetical protein